MSDIAAVEILQMSCGEYSWDIAELLNKTGNAQG
jgi:hypothetical protein